MKLLELSCPHCGAHLEIDSSRKQAFCKYCGAALLIDDEMKQLKYENAEEAGYKFEKGRQRAQAEVIQEKKPSPQQSKKRRLTWLWVLGWICIFPVPLTIILLRKKDMKPAIKYSIIVVAWVFYLLIAATGNSSDNSTQSGTVRTSQSSVSTSNISKLEMLHTDEVVLEVGQKTPQSWVNVHFRNRNNFSPDDVVFVSDNPDVAKIEFTEQALTSYLYYQITAVGPGETEVYVRSQDGSVESAHRKVSVPRPIEISSVSIENSKSELFLGEAIILDVKVSPTNAKDKSITWSSSDDLVACINSKGELLAVGGGTATISASSSNGISDSFTVNVDASKRILNVKIVRDRTDDNNIGNDWFYVDKINGEPAAKTIAVSVGDVLQIDSEYQESDERPDIGKASTKHKITQNDIDNGFEVTLELYVRENGGMNRGKKAHFLVTFIFST